MHTERIGWVGREREREREREGDVGRGAWNWIVKDVTICLWFLSMCSSSGQSLVGGGGIQCMSMLLLPLLPGASSSLSPITASFKVSSTKACCMKSSVPELLHVGGSFQASKRLRQRVGNFLGHVQTSRLQQQQQLLCLAQQLGGSRETKPEILPTTSSNGQSYFGSQDDDEQESFFEQLKKAWQILFPSKTKPSSNAEIAKKRLKMILVSDRCSINDQTKRKIVSSIVSALSDFVEIESEEKVQLDVTSDLTLGTVYSVTVPVCRVKPEYQSYSNELFVDKELLTVHYQTDDSSHFNMLSINLENLDNSNEC